MGDPIASCPVRLRGMGFSLPGDPKLLVDLDLSVEERQRLFGLGQEFFHQSSVGSTELMVEAGAKALESADISPAEIGMVISAPSVITSYGLEIPAIEIRHRLGLHRAESFNLGQGCVGIFRAMQLAGDRLCLYPECGDVLVLTGCVASTVTRRNTHGAFFWGDGAAAVVLSTTPGRGLQYKGYAECSTERDWGAMRIGFGDAKPVEQCDLDRDFHISVAFSSDQDQLRYIEGERERFGKVVDRLLCAGGLTQDGLTGLVMPSLGKNRIRTLIPRNNPLRDKVISDARYGHMGGVDALLFLHQHLKNRGPTKTQEWYVALTPAFTVQWGGVLLSYLS